MLLKQLQYYVAVVESGSFTEAAEQCFISQSAISQQIRALESDIGIILLQRSGRSFHLTPAGEVLYRRAKDVIRDVEDMKQEIMRIAEQGKSVLTIGYLSSYGGQALLRTIHRFSQNYAAVEFHSTDGTHEELYEKLRVEEIDLILNDQRRAFSDNYMNYELGSCPCSIVVTSSHTWCERDSIELKELNDTPCILIAGKAQREEEQLFYQELLQFSGTFLFAETMAEATMMVMNQRGFLVVEGGSINIDTALMKQIPLVKEGREVQRTYCAFWKKKRTNAYLEEFAEILRDEFQKEQK